MQHWGPRSLLEHTVAAVGREEYIVASVGSEAIVRSH